MIPNFLEKPRQEAKCQQKSPIVKLLRCIKFLVLVPVYKKIHLTPKGELIIDV
jgi:hypothetical protein